MRIVLTLVSLDWVKWVFVWLKILLKMEKKIVVYDIVTESMNQMGSKGASKGSSPLEIAQNSEIVITMLPSSPHVMDVYIKGQQNLLKGAKNGQLFIDNSTIDPNVAREVYQHVKKSGATILDAPVSGGINGAANATLTFMVGGDKEAFDRATPILKLMGKTVVHCGGPGNGQVAKVCNNLQLGISMIGASEALNLGVKLGMDPKVLTTIINSSSGRSWSTDTYNPVPGVMPNVPSSKNYEGGFMVNLMLKDLGLAVGSANSINQPLPLGAVAHQVYSILSRSGYGNLDFSSVYKFLNEEQQKTKK